MQLLHTFPNEVSVSPSSNVTNNVVDVNEARDNKIVFAIENQRVNAAVILLFNICQATLNVTVENSVVIAIMRHDTHNFPSSKAPDDQRWLDAVTEVDGRGTSRLTCVFDILVVHTDPVWPHTHTSPAPGMPFFGIASWPSLFALMMQPWLKQAQPPTETTFPGDNWPFQGAQGNDDVAGGTSSHSSLLQQ